MNRIGEMLQASLIPISLDPADIERMSEAARMHEAKEAADEMRRRVEASGIPSEYRRFGRSDVMQSLGPWTDSFGERRSERPRQSLLFLGKTGRGKTSQACAIGMAVLERCPTVRFVTASSYLRQIGDAISYGEPRGNVVAKYSRARLLILDDLGKDPATDWSSKAIWDLINERGDRPTIVTSQYDEASLLKRFSTASDRETAEAIVSRVFGMYRVLFDGDDMRRRK